MQGPAVVTLLLGMVQEGIPGALAALESCLEAADPEVRRFGALALAAYQPRLAADHIARALSSSEAWRRGLAGEMLLELGDARGLPARIDNLELGSAVYGDVGSQAVEASRGVRMFACQDLRVYSQQPLPCDPNATGADLARQVAAWRGWWEGSGSKSPLRVREARLDLQAQYQVLHVTFGDRVAR